MSELKMTLEANATTTDKAQPWKAIWPASEEAARVERRQSGGGSGLFAYNDNNEGIAPKKKEGAKPKMDKEIAPTKDDGIISKK